MLVRGQVRDISASGLCLVTNLPIQKGATLHLSFRLSTGLIEAVGEVRWVKHDHGQPRELGIRFVRIPLTSTSAIARAVEGDRIRDLAA